MLGNGEDEEEDGVFSPVWNTTRERLVTGEAGVIRRHGCNQRRNVSLLVRPYCVPPPGRWWGERMLGDWTGCGYLWTDLMRS